MSGLETISLDLENELDVYLKIFLFLYADDTDLLSDSSTELQILLNKFANYCHNWKLQINTEKTEILIFSKGRVPQNLKFFIDKDEIEIVKEYKYLGIFFARSGSFLRTREYLYDQGIKAMYSILKKGRENNLSI